MTSTSHLAHFALLSSWFLGLIRSSSSVAECTGFTGRTLLSGVKYSFRLTTPIITDRCWNVFLSSPC
jgi:hypothetical protein